MSIGSFLSPPGFEGPRGLRTLSREASAAIEVGRYLRHHSAGRAGTRRRPYVTASPPVGGPVMLIPGFFAGDASLGLMSRFLRAEGYRTYRSHIHVNIGCTLAAADHVERRIEAIAIRRNARLTLVGHSLGGLLARGMAARRPDLVSGIVTMGSPMLAPGAAHTLLQMSAEMLTRLSDAGFRRMMSADCIRGACAEESFRVSRLEMTPEQSFVAIYSKRDGIVDWRGCVDPAGHAIEVPTSHVGMAFDPIVFHHVLHALRHPEEFLIQAATPTEAAG